MASMRHYPELPAARRAFACGGMGSSMTRLLSLSVLVFLLAYPNEAHAQDHTHEQPSWVADVGVAGANIVAGAVTAAATALIRGEDVTEAFFRGAAGGSVAFVGKRLAVERFSGAGLLGRQVASVGASMVVDAGNGRGLFSEVWLPVGPAWVQVRPEAELRARVNLRDVGTVIWAATRSELSFDLERSLSNGAPVFVAQDHAVVAGSRHADGVAVGGVIVLGATTLDTAVIQRHENVHVIQHDYLLQTLSRPIEQWAWTWVTEREIVVDLNLLPILASPVLADIQEREAQVLEFR